MSRRTKLEEYDLLSCKIRAYINKIGTLQEVAQKMGMSYSTLYRKLNNPSQFTIDDFRRLYNVCGICKTDMLDMIAKVVVS